MTMPAVITNYQKQETVSRLKKAYTIINQALRMSEAYNGEFENWEDGFSIGAENYLNKYWLPYFNVSKLCVKYSTCGYKSSFPYIFLNGEKSPLTFSSPDRRIPFLTNDGSIYSISIAGGDVLVKEDSIYIDINGSKGPNKFGKDLFVFTRVNKKGILPLGFDNEINDCRRGGEGNYCAKKIIEDGWQIKEDYPW